MVILATRSPGEGRKVFVRKETTIRDEGKGGLWGEGMKNEGSSGGKRALSSGGRRNRGRKGGGKKKE